MFRSRLFWKLYAAFVVVTLSTAGVVYFVGARRVRVTGLAQLEASLHARASIVERFLVDRGGLDEPGLEAVLRDLGPKAETRFTVIAADGRVVADSDEDPAAMESHAQRPEVHEALASGCPATAVRFSRTLREEMMYLALPVRGGGGVVRAALPLQIVNRRLADLAMNLGGAVLAASVLSLVLGMFLFFMIARPLRQMTAAAEQIAAGDYAVRVAVHRSDEVGQLAGAIERMSEQLRDRLAALTEERNQLHGVLSGMLEGVIAVDREERILHLNGPAAGFLDLPAGGALGRRIWELTRIEGVCSILADVLRSGSEASREIRLPKSLRERVLELHAAPLRDPGGAVGGAVLVLHDVSRLRRLETVRRDFVANVSHELKTPLTAIRGYAETLLEAEDVDRETRQRFLGRIRDQTLRLSNLVTDLLTLSRVESAGASADRRPLDLREALSESARRFQAEAPDRGLSFAFDLPPDPVPVMGDAEGLRQAADNLLDNAFKYTPAGGRVSLRCRAAGGAAVVEVADTGIGIEAEHLDRIFERFYRVDKARSRELGGTGLGLSIVKHIVEAHGGEVAVESRPGSGSTFCLRIPLRDPADVSPAA